MFGHLLLATLALATTPVAPISVKFTSDSVYTVESIISPKEVIAEETEGFYTIILEKDHLLGYTIYDNKDTEYIDGLKFDNAFVTNWMIEHVKLDEEHTILVKTVYTEDVAGMLAAAKDGDWSRLLSNPVTIFQLVYYKAATITLIVGGFGLFRSKRKKVKDHEQIASESASQVHNAAEVFKEEAIGVVTSIVTPVVNMVKDTRETMIKGFILAQSHNKTDSLQLIEMLKNSTDMDVDKISDDIRKAITDKFELKEKAKKEAADAVAAIAKDALKPVKELNETVDEAIDKTIGGISI